MEAVKKVMKNKRVAPLLNTTTITPILSDKLLAGCERLLKDAPKSCREQQMRPLMDTLKADLVAFRKLRDARGFGDKERQAAHSKLCRCYCNALTKLIGLLNHKKPSSQCLLTPVTEDLLYDTIVATADSGNYSCSCSGCAGDFRGKASLTEFKDGMYCPGCLERYTYKCSCGFLGDRQELTAKQILRHDRKGSKDSYFCPKCIGKVKHDFICNSCNCMVQGLPANGQNISAEEIAKELGRKLCRGCASSYSRAAGCGHITNNPHSVRTVQNVEDDSRERETIHDENQVFCRKCYEDQRAEERPLFWDQKRSEVSGSTHKEIGSKRSFGVELEVCQARDTRPMPEAIKAAWTSKLDQSLPQTGVEFASTILYGDAGLKVIKDLCQYGREHGWSVDARAGYHLHVGLAGEQIEAVAAVAMGYHLTYQLWASFVAASRQKCKYCRRNGYSAEKLLSAPANEVLHLLQTDPKLPESERRRVWINWHSYKAHTTVENRFHHPTLDYDKIANWVKANIRFVDWCVSLKTHKAVYDILSGKDTRQQFLLISRLAWKDNGLARWLRLRAQTLHGESSFLAPSNRSLRKAGKDPKDYKPKSTTPKNMINGRLAYPARAGVGSYTIIDHPTIGAHSAVLSPTGWRGGSGVIFPSRELADNYIHDAAERGVAEAYNRLVGRVQEEQAAPAGTTAFEAAVARLQANGARF